MSDPAGYGQRLRKDLAGSWKLRAGDYRVVYEILPGREAILILLIAHRREAYEIASKRRA